MPFEQGRFVHIRGLKLDCNVTGSILGETTGVVDRFLANFADPSVHIDVWVLRF